jgi:hypothetical protein
VAILLILGGCLTTNRFGKSGRLILAEGKQDNRIHLDTWTIQAAAHGMDSRGQATVIPISEPPKVGRTFPFDLAGQSYNLTIVDYADNAESEAVLQEGRPEDQPNQARPSRPRACS